MVCRLADAPGTDEVRQAAADAGRALTGYPAKPGKAWTIWWRDHAAEAPRWGEIDGLIADLHDAGGASRAALAGFTPEELMPLVDAVLEQDRDRLAPWWPERALAAIRTDDPARWAPALAARCIAADSARSHERLGLILLLDELAGPAADTALTGIAADLVARERRERRDQDERQIAAPDHGVERQALAVVLRRRGLPVPF